MKVTLTKRQADVLLILIAGADTYGWGGKSVRALDAAEGALDDALAVRRSRRAARRKAAALRASTPASGALIPQSVADAILDNLTHPNPYIVKAASDGEA